MLPHIYVIEYFSDYSKERKPIDLLSYIHKMVTRLEDENSRLISWRVFITFSVLSEAFSAVIDRKSVVRLYRQNLKKAAVEFAECITLEAFLKIIAWFDEHLLNLSKAIEPK